MVYPTSVKTGEGIDAFAAALAGRISVVTGPSGAGKSSLLNAVQPGLKLRIGEISAKLRRGKNTTVSAVMLPLDNGRLPGRYAGVQRGGTLGNRAAGAGQLLSRDAAFIGECRYADCRHMTEPGCRIQAAADAGEILPDRLESYRVCWRSWRARRRSGSEGEKREREVNEGEQ